MSSPPALTRRLAVVAVGRSTAAQSFPECFPQRRRRRAVRIGPWLRAALVGGSLLAVTLGPAAEPAWAHSQLVSMSPADGSTVSTPPTQVLLTFDENIQDIGAAVVVTGPDGTRVDQGPPVIVDATATEALAPLILRGHYTVSYRVVSTDGHPMTQTLGFDLSTGQQAAPPATPASGSPPAATPGSVRPAVLGVVAAFAALGLVVTLAVRSRARRRTG